MKEKQRRLSKGIIAPLIALLVFAAVSLLQLSGALHYLDYKTYDLRVRILAGRSKPSDEIILILLDQRSLDWAQRERGWSWPWPRSAYAEIVDYMRIGKAGSIAFDVIFSEPSIYRNARQDEIIDNAVASLETAQEQLAQQQAQTSQASRNQGGRAGSIAFREIVRSLQELSGHEDDASFARAEEEFGRVVQTVFFSTESGSAAVWPADLDKPFFTIENFDPILSRFALAEKGVGAQFPIPELRNAAGAIGCITGSPDSDSVIRRTQLFTYFDGRVVPSLSAAPLLTAGHTAAIEYDKKKQSITWGDYSIPVDREGKSLLHFRGNLDRYAPYSASAVLQSAEAYTKGVTAELDEGGYLPPEDFNGKYVFFGYNAPGLFDIFNTPISSVYPGVGTHVTMLDNILSGDFIRETPAWISRLIILAAVLLITVLTLFSNRIPLTLAGTVFAVILIIFLGLWAYAFANLWLPVAAPLAGILAAFLTATVYNYATEGSQKRFIKSAFSQILSPKVIDQIIADPSKLELGGEKRDMTAIFTDIQRFSSISSELQDQYGENGPKELVNLLNLYLTEMSNIVLANGGTIDKYEGDAIIAFFGAPVWMEDHAALACRSAIQMKKRERDFKNQVMNPEGKFYSPLTKLIEKDVIRRERPLYTRLGINSGDMVVGFMGTPQKKDYTIMGNAVNLAARLEGVNKQYDTRGILISEYTRKHIGDEFIIRPLSRVTVVGIPTPLRLYELLDLRGEASQELVEMTTIWEKAFASYENKDFSAAGDLFKNLYAADAEDLTAKLYLGKCEKYLAVPPPADWDGVDNLTEK
jgi:adenylate cyclase